MSAHPKLLSKSLELHSWVFQIAKHLPVCFCLGWRVMFMFWFPVQLLTQKPFTAVLREGEWLQSPFPMGLKTDPDSISEAGTTLSSHTGSLESRQDSYKGAKRPENCWKSPALHHCIPQLLQQPYLVWSFPAKQLLSSQRFLTGLPSYYTHLAAGLLTSVFCPGTGYFTVLSGTFLLQHVWILLWITIVLCSQNPASVCFFSSSSAQFLFGSYLQLLGCHSHWECSLAWTLSLYLVLSFAVLPFICKDFTLFPIPTAIRRKQAVVSLSPCLFHLCGLCYMSGQVHDREPFLDTGQLCPSQKILVYKWL